MTPTAGRACLAALACLTASTGLQAGPLPSHPNAGWLLSPVDAPGCHGFSLQHREPDGAAWQPVATNCRLLADAAGESAEDIRLTRSDLLDDTLRLSFTYLSAAPARRAVQQVDMTIGLTLPQPVLISYRIITRRDGVQSTLSVDYRRGDAEREVIDAAGQLRRKPERLAPDWRAPLFSELPPPFDFSPDLVHVNRHTPAVAIPARQE